MPTINNVKKDRLSSALCLLSIVTDQLLSIEPIVIIDYTKDYIKENMHELNTDTSPGLVPNP